jgi:hypothetical protein
MSDEFFNAQRSAIESQLRPGETMEDIATMYSIIMEARHERKPLRKEDKRIGLWSLCFLGVPYKAPLYSDGIKQFRSTFIGIAVERSQQKRFRRSLKPALLDAETVNDLKAEKLSDLFNESSDYETPSDSGTGTPTMTGGGEVLVEPVGDEMDEGVSRTSHTQTTYMTH